MNSPHALILPYPVQGHVIPLMELANCLVDRGFHVTFVNTEFNHDRIIAASSNDNHNIDQKIRLVSIPDGLQPGEDRNDLRKLTDSIQNVVPGKLEEIMQDCNEKFTCFVVDWSMAWTLGVARKMGLRSAMVWPACPGMLVAVLSIPKLIEDGVIDGNGRLKKQEMISLGPGMPPMNSTHLYWTCIGDTKTEDILYNLTVQNNRNLDIAEYLICNTFHEIELPEYISAPNILTVGPLLANMQFGHFWPEDPSCMTWLDEQAPNSVIYIAFGSLAVFDRRQFEELALGLELTGRSFLWVVRPDLIDGSSNAYPDGFRDRVMQHGKMVGWSPQQKVLAHPSIACFISHCGWNSTLDGVMNGVPFLCWPYFTDQFLNETYICDVWRVGLRFSHDESGIVSREEIKSKVEDLFGDEELRSRALVLKETANRSIDEGGLSYKNLNIFADAMKE